MRKINRIRLSFALGAVLCLGSYYYGYHEITGNYPGESEDLAEISTEADTTEMEEAVAEPEEEEPATESVKIQENYEYVVVEEDDYLTVYYSDLKTKYMDTDITMSQLGKDVQKEIQTGKKFENAEDLYNFLENYSS